VLPCKRLPCCKALDVAADIRVGGEDHVSCRVAMIATAYAKVCRPGVLEVQKRLGRLVEVEGFGGWSVGVWSG
jgi:hypothetical protein